MAEYNYRKIAVIFDLDFEDDKVLLEWLEKNKNKRNSFSEQLKKALRYFMGAKNEQL